MRTLGIAITITVATGVCLLVVTTFLTASLIADDVTLAGITVAQFVDLYRIALACAAAAGIAGTIGWLVYGSKPARVMALRRARGAWTTIWFLELLAGASAVIGLLVSLLTESFSPGNLAFLFVMMSLHTWVFFWLCSLLLSHLNVRHVPWLSR